METIFDITKFGDAGCGFYLQKIIGFLILKGKREFHDALGISDYFISSCPISISDYDSTCDLDIDEEIIGLIPTNDCYEVFGLNDTTKAYDSIGYIFDGGKASNINLEYWEHRRKENSNKNKKTNEKKTVKS